MTTELNFHALAAEIVAASVVPDPSTMVDDFVGRIEPEDYREAIRYLSRDLITAVIRQRRSHSNSITPGGSRKVAAARDAWRRMLDTPEFVPSVGWVFLRDATHTQVLEMAGSRRQKSAELGAAADRYEHLAAEMQTHSVMRVSDLPEDVLAPLLDQTGTAA